MKEKEFDYQTLSEEVLKNCLRDLHNYAQTCDYEPMLNEYQRRITEINMILKQRRNARTGTGIY